MKQESRFEVGPNGETKDKMQYVVNKFEDVKNYCGSQFNPDTNEYWDLIKGKLKEFSEEEMWYLLREHLQPLIDSGGVKESDKITDTIRSIWKERREN